jgi:hypothetical protein
VNAETTREAMRIQADHALRALEAVASRLMMTISATVDGGEQDGALGASLARDAKDLGEIERTLSQRFEAWFPFRSHWPCGGDVLRLQIELLNGPLPLELGLPDLLQRDADDEAAVSLRPIKL